MMTKKCFFMFLLILCGLVAKADTVETLLDSLDRVIEQQDDFWQQKVQYMNVLKEQARRTTSDEQRLQLYHDIFQAYSVADFDSAHAYAERGLQLATLRHNDYYTSLNTILLAETLIYGGMYAEAAGRLEGLDDASMATDVAFLYQTVCFRLNQYRADFCADEEYAPVYRQKGTEHLLKASQRLQELTDIEGSDYYWGEYYTFVEADRDKAKACYLKATERLDPASRLYAMACFALVGNYRDADDSARSDEYLIRAAISDVLNCSKESMALQELAQRLFTDDNRQLERAQRYINTAMADAKNSGNRLRIIGIAQKSPAIIATYQDILSQQNRTLRWALWGISLLTVAMLLLLAYSIRQNSLLTQRRHELARSNTQLTELNGQLHDLNGRLVSTNRHREGLAKLYIDLCAKYIDRLERFQLLVQRKIKANQTGELLAALSSQRLSAEENAAFMNRFDKTFLDLYPTFISEFNALLKPDEQVVVSRPNTMTTELRIFALIRLGVTESSEIAALLQFAPRTIYNYRSSFKNKVLDREHFEDQVRELCLTN